MVHKLTAQDRVQTVAARWHKNYNSRFDINPYGETDKTFGNIYDEIKNETDPAKIIAAIGNKSWTSVTCHECSEGVEEVAVFSVNSDEYTLHLCKACCMKVWEK